MSCGHSIHRLLAAALTLVVCHGAAWATDLRLDILLTSYAPSERRIVPPPFAVRASPDGRRVIVDLPFERFSAPPRLETRRQDMTLRWGPGPDGLGRLVLSPEAPVSLVSAALRPAPEFARLTLVLRPAAEAAAVLAPTPRPAPPPQADEAPLVMIDPGHGGIAPGAVVGGIREKDVADAFAADLAAALRASGRWRVAFTRDGDRFMRLDDRWRRAEAEDADILLSIHANTVARGDAEGATVFTLAENGGSAEARALARLENQGAAPDPRRVSAPPERRALDALARRRTLAESRNAGDGIAYALSLATPMLRGRAHEQAGFRVLRSAHVPSALIELGFLTNADDLARLQDPDWRARAAGALAAGLESWRARAAGLSSDPARRYAPAQGNDRVAARKAERE